MSKIGQMQTNIASTLDRLGEKSRFLTERFKVVAQQRDEALARVAELEKQLHDSRRQLQLLQTETEYLKVSSVLAPTAESVTQTRVMIREIISEIDRCLAELND